MMPENGGRYGRIMTMPSVSRPLRLLLFAMLALVTAAILWALFGALRSGLALWHEVRDLPAPIQIAIATLMVAIVLALFWIGWRLLRPRRHKRAPVAPPTRAQIDQRVARLHEQRADTALLQTELEELDRRARSEELYVAVFGEISAGKSSLIKALAPHAAAQTDVLGGTTRSVAHYRSTLADGAALTFADVPGTHEVFGASREQLARDEALRAHVVVYVCAGDLTREQDAELRWLRSFGKPLLLLLNKADQLRAHELAALEAALRERYAPLTDAQLIISAGGMETFERQLPDGRSERVQRERVADVESVRSTLERIAAYGAQVLEPGREAAVLTAILPVVLGIAGVFATAVLSASVRGVVPMPTHPLSLAGGMVVGLLTAWWGIGGTSLRRGSRSLVRAAAPGRGGAVVASVPSQAVASSR